MSAVGGAITVLDATNRVQADLPWTAGWTISTVRMQAEEVSLSGAMIRQSAAKSITTGTATYSGPVNSTQAANLATIDNAATTVILGDGTNVYEAIMDAKVGANVSGGKRQVAAEFRIVRQIV